MKTLSVVICCLLFSVGVTSAFGQTNKNEKEVIAAVRAFYDGFTTGTFAGAENYTTDDWNHINPNGGRTRGRTAVLVEVRAVHQTFLKGVSDTPEEIDVRFASPTVAVATVTSRLSTFTSPDGVKQIDKRNIRTFVVVKQKARWLIMQDHNTIVAS
jgi:uncharacterized protein (TIGR02246 family)